MSRVVALALSVAMLGCVPAERQADDRGRARPEAERPKLTANELVDVLAEPGAGAGVTDPDPLPTLQAPFRDEFEREALGADYFSTSDAYRLEGGRLCVRGARNHPLWLRHRLPTNARIQVEAEPASSDGDIKLEAWGDGRTAATRITYTDATSYLAIFGGWRNRYHVLARMDEHAPDRREIVIEPGSDDPRQQPVMPKHRYRMKVERTDGRTVRFWVDDVELLNLLDPQPLAGGGHEHFAFNDWETPVCFDHLVVEPLPS